MRIKKKTGSTPVVPSVLPVYSYFLNCQYKALPCRHPSLYDDFSGSSIGKPFDANAVGVVDSPAVQVIIDAGDSIFLALHLFDGRATPVYHEDVGVQAACRQIDGKSVNRLIDFDGQFLTEVIIGC